MVRLNYLMFLLCSLTAVSIHQGLPPFAGIGIAIVLGILWLAWGLVLTASELAWRSVVNKHQRKKMIGKPAKSVVIKENLADLMEEYKGASPAHILNARGEEYSSMFRELGNILKKEGHKAKHFEVISTFDFSDSSKIQHAIEAKTPEASEALTELKDRLLLNGNADITFS